MTTAQKMARVAQTDQTFARRGELWVGKCLICNGPLAFDAQTGAGATLEHIRARGRGGAEELANLGLVHGRWNHDKGRRWGPKRRRPEPEDKACPSRFRQRPRAPWPR